MARFERAFQTEPVPFDVREKRSPNQIDRIGWNAPGELPLVVRWGEFTEILGRSRVLTFLLAFALVFIVALLDFKTEGQLQLAFFYLAPITYVAWFGGRRIGLVFGVACAGIGLTCDLLLWDGTPSHVLVPFWNAAIRLFVFFVVVSEQASIKAAFERERQLARLDPLTGIANLRMFREELEHELVRCRRYPHPFTVAFIDLDDFKLVNDRHGHKAGDAALEFISGKMRGNLRATDTCARLGGDEFAILLPETSYPAAMLALGKIQHGIRTAPMGKAPRVSASIGAVTFDEPPATVDEVIARTDHLMYTVKKRAGKDSIAVARAMQVEPVDLNDLNGIDPAMTGVVPVVTGEAAADDHPSAEDAWSAADGIGDSRFRRHGAAPRRW